MVSRKDISIKKVDQRFHNEGVVVFPSAQDFDPELPQLLYYNLVYSYSTRFAALA